MSTLRDMITGAARLINIVQQGSALGSNEMNICLYALDTMIDSWSADNLMIYVRTPYSFPTVGGQKQYTVGPGGQWDNGNGRPMEISQAYVDYSSGVGSQLVTIPLTKLTYQQYGDIAVKDVQATFPLMFYDNGDYPLRTLSLYPVPTTTQNIVLWMREPLVDLTALDATVSFPKGYERALRFNLAIEIAAEFGKQVAPEIIATAQLALSEIKRLNAVPHFISFGAGLSTSNTKGGGWPYWLHGDTVSGR